MRSGYTCTILVVLLSTINNVSSLAVGQADPTITISGKDNPSMIPDGTAYDALFGVFRRTPSETDDLYKRRVATRIAAIGLTNEEGSLLLNAAENYAIEVKKHEARTKELRQKPHLSLQEVQQLRNERDALAMMILADLRAKLSAEGRQKLASYVEFHVKPHMVVRRIR